MRRVRTIAWLSLVGLAASSGCERKGGGGAQASATATAAPKPRAQEGGPCQANADCAEGFGCADDKKCQSFKTIECRSRGDTCKRDGLCTGADKLCVAGSDADCKAAQVCQAQGQCTAKDGKCVAATAEDCKQRCTEAGLCTVRDGKCVAASDDDCKESEACKKYKKCTAESGSCFKIDR